MTADPSHIMQVGMGFFASKTVLSAVELEVFTHLGGGSMSGPELGERLGLHERGIDVITMGLILHDWNLDYTGADFAGWCRDVGFREVEVVPLTGPASAGIAFK